MSDWLIIALFVLTGIALIIVEILLVPGTTIVGFIGFAIGIYGIYRSYEIFGTEVGNYVLAGSLVLGFTSIFVSFKSGAWKKFTLNDSIDAKVNPRLTEALKVGQVGVSKSTLRPIGKAEFEDKEYEVKTLGNYIDTNTPIRIIEINGHTIFVESIN